MTDPSKLVEAYKALVRPYVEYVSSKKHEERHHG